jgi:hypothetical protein
MRRMEISNFGVKMWRPLGIAMSGWISAK